MAEINSITMPFLHQFYGDAISPEARFAIWYHHNRHHHWCSSVEEAEKHIDTSRDVYFTMGLFPKGVTKRLQENCIGIMGVWLDIDIKKDDVSKNYFVDFDQALEWVKEYLAGYWTWIVCSGKGLHVYLMFDEPFWIETESDRERARKLTKGFWSWANDRCPRTIDSVYDLSRVMRVPGTMNTKHNLPCHMVDQSGTVIAASDLEEFLPEVALTDTSEVEVEADGEVDINTLKEQIQYLRDSSKDFDATWRRARRLEDNSPSGYVLSIATQMCANGFNDAEVLVAIKMWRSTQTDASPKGEQYFLRALIKAREFTKENSLGNAIEAAAESDSMAQKFEIISTVFGGKKVSEIIKRITPKFKGKTEKPSYIIRFEDGDELIIPDTETMMSQSRVRAIAFEEADIMVANLKKNKWDTFLTLVLDVKTDEMEALEGNTAYNILSELRSFVAKKRELGAIVDDLSLLTGSTLLEEDGIVYFQWSQFRRHLSSIGYASYNNKNLSLMLKDLGCGRKQFADDRRTRLWAVPPEDESEREDSDK
jgi:hypothetical protein